MDSEFVISSDEFFAKNCKLFDENVDENKHEYKQIYEEFLNIQEKVIEGDFEYVSGVKLRKARRIKNFKQDLKVNQELYDVAKEFAA